MPTQQFSSKSPSAAIIALWSIHDRNHSQIEVVSATPAKLINDKPYNFAGMLIAKRHMAGNMSMKVTFDVMPMDVEDALYRALDSLADDFAALPEESAAVFSASSIRFDDRFAQFAAFRKTGSLQWVATFPWTGDVLPDEPIDPRDEGSLTAAQRNPSLVSAAESRTESRIALYPKPSAAQAEALSLLTRPNAVIEHHGEAYGQIIIKRHIFGQSGCNFDECEQLGRVHINTIRALGRNGWIVYRRDLTADAITDAGRKALN